MAQRRGGTRVWASARGPMERAGWIAADRAGPAPREGTAVLAYGSLSSRPG